MPRFEGRVAIVTGAGRGIGRAEALQLAAEGASVVVNDIGGDPSGQGLDRHVADEAVDAICAAGGKAVANYDSIATMAGAESAVRAALDAFGRLDILINNAGNVRPRMVYNLSEEDWDAVIDVHLKGHFATIKAASQVFRSQRGGVIVNTASESGLGHLGQANYSAAKEGIVGLTRTVARDLGRYGVRCNAIRPRAATRLGDEVAVESMIRTQRETGVAALGSQPVGHDFLQNRPDQVAAVVAWLCSDAAANVNGRTFQVGGDVVGLYPEPEVIRSIHREGGWTLDALDRVAPSTLTAGLSNHFLPRQQP
jgi:NAD(P)-dependent dehydrogenase (short-subunit alcohol dehydrogenase family)